MRQEEIVNEIIKKCGNAEIIPSMGWHFMYNGRNFFYITGKNDGMIRFCIPHLVKADEYEAAQLSEAINDTNRSVKFIKVIKLDCGSVSLNYDYKTSSDETAEAIVSHIITALDFASAYLLNRLGRK